MEREGLELLYVNVVGKVGYEPRDGGGERGDVWRRRRRKGSFFLESGPREMSYREIQLPSIHGRADGIVVCPRYLEAFS